VHWLQFTASAWWHSSWVWTASLFGVMPSPGRRHEPARDDWYSENPTLYPVTNPTTGRIRHYRTSFLSNPDESDLTGPFSPTSQDKSIQESILRNATAPSDAVGVYRGIGRAPRHESILKCTVATTEAYSFH